LPSSCVALNAVYESTVGSSWDDKDNWMDGCPCTNNWYGVDCDDGEVVKLKIHGNNLDGSIPTQLGLLTGITKELKLNSNQLTGEIPTELGLLGDAKKIELKDNMLCGEIPDEIAALDGVDLKITTGNSLGTACVVNDFSTETLPTYAPTAFVPIKTYGTSALDFVVEVGDSTCSEVFEAIESSLTSVSTSAQTELVECASSATSTRRHLTVTTMEIAIAVKFLLDSYTDDGDESATDATIQMVQEFTDDLTAAINDDSFIDLFVQSLGTDDEVNLDTDALMSSLSVIYDTIEVEEIIRSRPPSFRPTTDPVQKNPVAESNDLIKIGGAAGGLLASICIVGACVYGRKLRMKSKQDKPPRRSSILTEKNVQMMMMEDTGDRGEPIDDSADDGEPIDDSADDWEYSGWTYNM